MDYLKLNGYILPFSGHSEIVEVKPSPLLLQNDCVSADHCILSSCFKGSCQTQSCTSSSDCILSSENGWCICTQNDSSSLCGPCSSPTEYSEDCLRTQKNIPLWIIAIVFPISFILLILTLCFVLKRQGSFWSIKPRSQPCIVAPTKQHGTYNGSFCPDDGEGGVQNISNENKKPDLIVAGELGKRAESFSQSCLTGFGGSELEYYEIDSTYTASCSKIKPLQGNTDSYDRAGLIGSLKKDCTQQTQNFQVLPSMCEETTKCYTYPEFSGLRQSIAFPTRIPGNMDDGCKKHSTLLLSKLTPELTDPPRYLSVDEVKILSIPLGQAKMGESSSESNSHSSFTCSEHDCERELRFISAQDRSNEHASEGTYNSEDLFVNTVSGFKEPLF